MFVIIVCSRLSAALVKLHTWSSVNGLETSKQILEKEIKPALEYKNKLKRTLNTYSSILWGRGSRYVRHLITGVTRKRTRRNGGFIVTVNTVLNEPVLLWWTRHAVDAWAYHSAVPFLHTEWTRFCVRLNYVKKGQQHPDYHKTMVLQNAKKLQNLPSGQ